MDEAGSAPGALVVVRVRSSTIDPRAAECERLLGYTPARKPCKPRRREPDVDLRTV
jgi:hypothetical protein